MRPQPFDRPRGAQRRPWLRSGSGALLGILTAISLSSCTPPTTGDLGIGVDSDGRPVGYVKTCEGKLDAADLLAEPVDDTSQPLGLWRARTGVSGEVSWSLAAGGSGWTRVGALAPLEDDVVYSFSAWASEPAGTTGHVLFTTADLAAMQPGQVRSYDVSRADASAPAGDPTGTAAQQARDENTFMRVTSEADFYAEACRRS